MAIGCHGYSRDVVWLASGHKDADRMRVEGYREEGRTGYCILMEDVWDVTLVNEWFPVTGGT